MKKAAPTRKPAPAKKAAPKLAIADTIKKPTPKRPQHRVYVIEVERLDPTVDWDYYVGYTNNFFKVRWEKYVDLVPNSVSGYFRHGKVKALGYRYDLMKGWGPYETKQAGELAEGDLALYLEDLGYRTYTDKLDDARKRRVAGIPMVGPKLAKKRRVRKKS